MDTANSIELVGPCINAPDVSGISIDIGMTGVYCLEVLSITSLQLPCKGRTGFPLAIANGIALGLSTPHGSEPVGARNVVILIQAQPDTGSLGWGLFNAIISVWRG